MYKNLKINYLTLIFCLPLFVLGQTSNPFQKVFPEGTVIHDNIPYNNDTLKKHLLDIYLPPNAKGKKLPLVILIHGGAWLGNDKYADLGYTKKELK
jgi:acetyl esterase/lipase